MFEKEMSYTYWIMFKKWIGNNGLVFFGLLMSQLIFQPLQAEHLSLKEKALGEAVYDLRQTGGRECVHSAVEDVVDTIPEAQVTGSGSHINVSRYTPGKSDHDFTMKIFGENDTEVLKNRWKQGRRIFKNKIESHAVSELEERIKKKLSKTIKDPQKVDKIIEGMNQEIRGNAKMLTAEFSSRTNLYPPSQLMEGVKTETEAAARFRELGAPPTILYENGEKLSEEVYRETAEGIYGKGAKAFIQNYENTSGMVWYKDAKTGKIRTGPVDLVHMEEGYGKYTAEGVASNAQQWALKAEHAIEIGDYRSAFKYTKRIEKDLAKGADLARLGKVKSRGLKKFVDKLNSIEFLYKDLPPDEKLKAINKAISKVLENPALKKELSQAIHEARLQAELLHSLSITKNPWAKTFIRDTMQETTPAAKKFLGVLDKNMLKKVPVSKILTALFVYMDLKDASQKAGRGENDEAARKLLEGSLFAIGSMGPATAAVVTNIFLDWVKERGFAVSTATQDCEDLLAQIIEVKGWESADSFGSRSETDIKTLALKIIDEKKIRAIVKTSIFNAASKGSDSNTIKEGKIKPLYSRCSEEIVTRWRNRRAEMVGDYLMSLQKLSEIVKSSTGIVQIEPNPALLLKRRGKDEKSASVDVTAELLSPQLKEILLLAKKVKRKARLLGGMKNQVSMGFYRNIQWFIDGEMLGEQEKSYNWENPISKRNLVFDKPGEHNITCKVEWSAHLLSTSTEAGTHTSTTMHPLNAIMKYGTIAGLFVDLPVTTTSTKRGDTLADNQKFTSFSTKALLTGKITINDSNLDDSLHVYIKGLSTVLLGKKVGLTAVIESAAKVDMDKLKFIWSKNVKADASRAFFKSDKIGKKTIIVEVYKGKEKMAESYPFHIDVVDPSKATFSLKITGATRVKNINQDIILHAIANGKNDPGKLQLGDGSIWIEWVANGKVLETGDTLRIGFPSAGVYVVNARLMRKVNGRKKILVDTVHKIEVGESSKKSQDQETKSKAQDNNVKPTPPTEDNIPDKNDLKGEGKTGKIKAAPSPASQKNTEKGSGVKKEPTKEVPKDVDTAQEPWEKSTKVEEGKEDRETKGRYDKDKKTPKSTKKPEKKELPKNDNTTKKLQDKGDKATTDKISINIGKIAEGIEAALPKYKPIKPKKFKIEIQAKKHNIYVNQTELLKIVNRDGKDPIKVNWNCDNSYPDGYKILPSKGSSAYLTGTNVGNANLNICATDADGKEAKEEIRIKIVPSTKLFKYIEPRHYGDVADLCVDSVNDNGVCIPSPVVEEIIGMKDYTPRQPNNGKEIYRYSYQFKSSLAGVTLNSDGVIEFNVLGNVEIWYEVYEEHRGSKKYIGDTQHIRTTILPKDNSPIDLNETLEKKSTEKPSEQEKLELTLKAVPKNKVVLGEEVKIKAIVNGGVPPYKYSWSGAEGEEEVISFKPTKAGTHKISVKVTDANKSSAKKSIDIIVEALKFTITGLPSENLYSSKTTLTIKSNSDMSKNKPIWQADQNGILFDPSEGTHTSVTFADIGDVNIWAYIADKNGKLIQESNRVHTKVTVPNFSLKLKEKTPLVGTEDTVTISTQAKIDNEYFRFRWLPMGKNVQMLGESDKGRSYRFKMKNINKTTLNVLVWAQPYVKKQIADLKQMVSAKTYEVIISKPKRLDKAPWKWDPKQGKAVELPQAIAVFQNAEVHCKVTPKPKEKLRYQWTVSPEGCTVSAPMSKSTNLNAHETGTYTVSVEVKDKNNVVLGKGRTSYTVTVSQRDIDVAKQKAKDQKKAKASLQEARKLWKEGKLQQAIAKVAQAQKLSGKNREIVKTLKAMQRQKKELDAKLNKASNLIKKDKLKDAEAILLQATIISDKYKRYKEVSKQLTDAKKKAEEQKKQIAKLLKDAKALKDTSKLDEANILLTKGKKQFPSNKKIEKLLIEVQKQQKDALGKMGKGQVQWKNGLLDKALSTLKKASKTDPSNKRITKVLNAMQGQKKRVDDLLNTTNKLIKEKKFDQAKTTLVQAGYISKKYPLYIEIVKKLDDAKKKDEQLANDLLKKAKGLWTAGKLDNAMALLTKGSKKFATHKEISQSLQKMQQDKKKLDSLVSSAEKLINQKKFIKADSLLKKAGTISKDYPPYIEAMKRLKQQKKKDEEEKIAKEKLRKKVQQQQEDARKKMAEGEAQWKNGQLAKAVLTLKEATKIDPSNKKIAKALKGMQGQKKIMDDALSKADRLIRQKKFKQVRNTLVKVGYISKKYFPYGQMLTKLNSAEKEEKIRQKKALEEKEKRAEAIRIAKAEAKRKAKLEEEAEKRREVAEKAAKEKAEKKAQLAAKIKAIREAAEERARIQEEKKKKAALAEKIRRIREEAEANLEKKQSKPNASTSHTPYNENDTFKDVNGADSSEGGQINQTGVLVTGKGTPRENGQAIKAGVGIKSNPGNPVLSRNGSDSINLTKKVFEPDEKISLVFTASPNYSGGSWIGMFKAGTPHRSAKKSIKFDLVGYKYLRRDPRGTFNFTAPTKEGQYDFRMFEGKSGKEIVTARFVVRIDKNAASFKLPQSIFAPNEKIKLSFTASPNYLGGSWIGMFKAGTPHRSAKKSTKYNLTGYRYLRKMSNGTFNFTAPTKGGEYDFRMFEGSNGREMVTVKFAVAVDKDAASFKLPQSIFAPNEKIKLSFTASPNYSGGSWIGMFKAGTPHRSAKKSTKYNLTGYRYLRKMSNGTFNFTAPTKEGEYDFRMFEGSDGEEVSTIQFEVKKIDIETDVEIPNSDNEDAERKAQLLAKIMAIKARAVKVVQARKKAEEAMRADKEDAEKKARLAAKIKAIRETALKRQIEAEKKEKAAAEKAEFAARIKKIREEAERNAVKAQKKIKSTARFMGTLSGSWKGPYGVHGSFQMKIVEKGKTSGSYWGDEKGRLSGSVSSSGKLNVKSGRGRAGSGKWGGAITVDSNGRLHGKGTWNVEGYKGSWHGR